ncbi:MAG: AcrR family transcriptional regulator [Desulforhopalus sp.]|jgi:AcrR family transcriptional regulator
MNLNVAEWTEKKIKIVETTIERVAAEGFENVTTAKIARKARVGEGTIYRHFKSKDELTDVAAEYAATGITKNIMKNYSPELPAKKQFMTFCHDFLGSAQDNQSSHEYLFQYLKSPQGLAYRKAQFGEIDKDPALARPLLYPMNLILLRAQEELLVKDMPLQVLALLTISSLFFVVSDAAAGLLKLDQKLINSITVACWDTVRK